MLLCPSSWSLSFAEPPIGSVIMIGKAMAMFAATTRSLNGPPLVPDVSRREKSLWHSKVHLVFPSCLSPFISGGLSPEGLQYLYSTVGSAISKDIVGSSAEGT